MIRRLILAVFALFWLIMNVLLWRAEFGSGKELGGSVPPEMIWHHILAAPDPSNLEVIRHGEKFGFLRWNPTIAEDTPRHPSAADSEAVEGMVQNPAGYSIDLEGTFFVNAPTNRLRTHLRLDFDPRRVWRELLLNIGQQSNTWTLRAREQTRTVELRVAQDGAIWTRQFTFAELANPERLWTEFGLPAVSGLFGGLLPVQHLSIGVSWQGYTGTLQVGHSRLRVYRLQAHLLDRYEVVVIVSRAGEILRVELPDDIILRSDVLPPG